MTYDIRYRKSARAEVDWLRDTYGHEFGEAWNEWTKLIAERSRRKDITGSVDVVEVLANAVDLFSGAERAELGQLLKKRWDDAAFWTRVKAVLVTIQKRTLPWQMRYSSRVLYCLGMGIAVELEILYEIDHVSGRVIIAKVGQVVGVSRDEDA